MFPAVEVHAPPPAPAVNGPNAFPPALGGFAATVEVPPSPPSTKERKVEEVAPAPPALPEAELDPSPGDPPGATTMDPKEVVPPADGAPPVVVVVPTPPVPPAPIVIE